MTNKITRVKNLKQLEYIILSFIIITALAARLYKINNPIADWHSWRQADTSSVSKIYAQEGIDIFYPRYYDISSTQTGTFNPRGLRFVEFPIFNALHSFAFKTFPLSFLSLEAWGRLVSVFSALISTFFLFLLGKRFIGRWGGVLAAFFYAFIPFNIFFTRVILPEPMAVTFALASLWIFVRFIDSDDFRLLYASSFLFAVAMLIKPFVFFYGVPMVYLASQKFGLKKVFKSPKLLIRFLLAVDIAFVPFFLWRVWINQYPNAIPDYLWMFNGDNIRFKPSFWRWIFGERLGHLILGGWGLIPFSFGVLKPKRYITRYRLGVGFNHFFLLGMLLYVVIFATVNVKHDYYQTITIPAIALALAYGTLYLWETKDFGKWASKLLLLFSLMVMFLTGALQIREFYKINRPEIVEAGKVVDEITPKDALVIAPYNGDTAFLYQTKRWGWPVVDRPINELIDKGADYFVSVDLNHPQTKEFSERFEVVKQTDKYVILKLHNEAI